MFGIYFRSICDRVPRSHHINFLKFYGRSKIRILLFLQYEFFLLYTLGLVVIGYLGHSAHVCIYVHTCACICLCMHMHAYACTCTHVYAYICLCMHMHAHVRICMHMHAYTYVYRTLFKVGTKWYVFLNSSVQKVPLYGIYGEFQHLKLICTQPHQAHQNHLKLLFWGFWCAWWVKINFKC